MYILWLTLGRCSSLTGQLRYRAGRGNHLAAVGALSAGADRATAAAQLRPLTVAVDEYAALIENAVEEERRVFLNLAKMRNIDPAAAGAVQANSQVERGGENACLSPSLGSCRCQRVFPDHRITTQRSEEKYPRS